MPFANSLFGDCVMDVSPGFVRRIVLTALSLMTLAGWMSKSARGLEFPQNPQQWLNSPPLSLKQVAGKAGLLYYFNEQDPECLANWKVMTAMAKEYEDQPVLFIAINSGGKRNEIDNYAQQVNLTWPILLDPDRSFEKKSPIEKVTPNNGMQVAVLTPDGKLLPGSWQQPQDSLKDVMKYAKWTLDPTSVPDSMRATWKQIEYQNYAAAAPAIKKALKSSKEDLKAGAETLLGVVTPLIAEKVAAAEAAYDAGEKWPAYRSYAELAEQFKGYELPENLDARKKELQTDASVKAELSAMKMFEAAKKQTSISAQKKKGMAALKKLVKDKPDTEAAKKAQELIDELEA